MLDTWFERLGARLSF